LIRQKDLQHQREETEYDRVTCAAAHDELQRSPIAAMSAATLIVGDDEHRDDRVEDRSQCLRMFDARP
jgi:hypothetical protein